MIDLVTQYAEGLIAGVEQRQPERAIDPPEPKEPSARACRDAADAFDAGDALALDWLADHQRDEEARAFTVAAVRYCGLDARGFSDWRHGMGALRDAYESLRAAFVDACAEEYE